MMPPARARSSEDAGTITADRLPDILRASFEWLPVGVLMVGAEGAIVLLNRSAEQLLAYAGAELIGQSLEVVLPRARSETHTGADARDTATGRETFARRKDGAEVPVEVRVNPMVIDGRSFSLISLVNLTERRRGEAQVRRALDERIEFEALVGDLAAQFVNLRPEDVDRTIEEALGRLVRVLDIDRSALCQVTEGGGDFLHTHQWTRPGRAVPPPRVSARERFPWHLSKVLSGEVATFSAVDEIPDAVDRESVRELGARSGVTIPLMIRGRAAGALTFAAVAAARTWTAEVVTRLRVVALVFASALARKERDEDLRRVLAGQADQGARLREENAYLRHELSAFLDAPVIVGNSVGTRRVLEQVRQVAASDAAVLLVGETGTGKSLLANRIHELSRRRDRALVRLHCDALSTSARHVELLELGDGSTVFFDEIADLPLDAQAWLARVLERREIQPIQGEPPISVDVRFIAGTRHDLPAAIETGSFRDDLYDRINVLSIQVPPLRERVEDIPLLVWRFVDEFSATYGKTIDTIDQDSMEKLQRYAWPGNARELRNVIERAIMVATSRTLRIAVPGLRGDRVLAHARGRKP